MLTRTGKKTGVSEAKAVFASFFESKLAQEKIVQDFKRNYDHVIASNKTDKAKGRGF